MNRRDERGSVTVFVTIMTVALILMAGLVVDGGQVLNARRKAANIAESAARAGAQELDEDAARRDGSSVLDVRRAVDRSQAFLVANGYHGNVSSTADRVTVDVQIRQPLLILGIGGLADMTVNGTGAATPLRGITEADP